MGQRSWHCWHVHNQPTFWWRVCCCWASYFPSSWGDLVIIFSNDDQLTWNRHIYETIQSPFKWLNMTGFFFASNNSFKSTIESLQFWHPKIPIGSHDALTKSTSTPCLRNGHPTEKNCLPSEAAKLLVSETTWIASWWWCFSCKLLLRVIEVSIFVGPGEDVVKILSKHLSFSSKHHNMISNLR